MFLGLNTGTTITTGSGNVSFGQTTLQLIEDGSYNSGFGHDVLMLNLSGSYNSAFGANALGVNETGVNNCGFGSDALTNSDSSNNSAFGTGAGSQFVTYTSCTFLGHLADATANNLTNAIAIGAMAEVSASNTCALGKLGTDLVIGGGTGNITGMGAITDGAWNASVIDVTYGGTGTTTFTSYGVICGGTTSTNPLQSISTGTTGQLLLSNGAGNLPSFQTYTGNNLITSVGIVTSGTWQADIISPTYGGTGINNGIKTIALGGNLVTSGANSLTLTTTGETNITLPTTGTLVNTAVTTLSSLNSIGTITTGTWNGSIVDVAYGGTGQSTLTNNSLLVGTGSSAVTQLPVGDTGTVLVGVTGSNPSFSTTPIVNSITINNDPITSTDGVNKAYVDALIAGLDFKEPCHSATTANLNAIYDNGTLGVGATLTNNGALAAFSVDGQSPAINSRILVKNQTTTFQDGIYNLTVVGSGAVAWVLTRSTDYDSSKDISPGNLVPVEFGTVNSVSSWIQTSVVGISGVGVDPITFTPFTYNPNSFLEVLNNLSDLDNITTARNNLGLTNVATQSVTLNNVLIGGSSNNITSLPFNNGQLLIGSTGNSPVAAVPTNGTNISWATGAGSLTANITGQIALANGGTNASLTASNGGIFYSTDSAGAILVGTATANQLLLSGANNAPSWSTATYPAVTTINQILYSSAANIVSGIATGNDGTLITSGAGVPSISSTLPTAVQTNITSLGTITTGVWNGTTVNVANGGTGVITTTAYGVICGGTTDTNPLQNTGAGTAGQFLISNGISALPTFQNFPSKSYASMYVSNNATSSGSTIFILAPGTTTAGPALNNFTHTNRRLRYNGSATIFVQILATLFEEGATGTKTYAIAINGNVQVASEMICETSNQTSKVGCSFMLIRSITTNDYIEVYGKTSGGTFLPVKITVIVSEI